MAWGSFMVGLAVGVLIVPALVVVFSWLVYLNLTRPLTEVEVEE